MPDKIQVNIKEFNESAFAGFTALVAGDPSVVIKKHSLPTATSHYDVYYCDLNETDKPRRSFVFHHDVKNKSLQITAESEIIETLSTVARELTQASKAPVAAVEPAPPAMPAEKKPDKKRENKPENKPEKKPEKKPEGKPKKPEKKPGKKSEPVPPLKADKQAVPSPVKEAENGNPEYKNGYCIRKYAPEWLDAAVARLSAKLSVTADASGSPDARGGSGKYMIEDKKKNRVYIQYSSAPRVVQLNGKNSELFAEVQSVISERAGLLELLEAHIEFAEAEPQAQPPPSVPGDISVPAKKPAKPPKPTAADKKAVKISKELEKAIPSAYNYLSDQSKQYLMFAMADLNSALNSYSGILGEAYKSLENFISNLQKSKNIEVKLIGQAYDKEGDSYKLKNIYQKKTNSVIYAEVMAALYTEYFNRRHFYSHSDNQFGTARIVSSQQKAKEELQSLLDLLNYNARKLDEIGFKFKENK